MYSLLNISYLYIFMGTLCIVVYFNIPSDINSEFLSRWILLLSIIYLVVLIRTNHTKEQFRSGPSPLNCKTYGDSKEKTGVAFYPLHDNMEENLAC